MASGAGDKIVKCLAVIGVLATGKALWTPIRNLVVGKKETAAEVA